MKLLVKEKGLKLEVDDHLLNTIKKIGVEHYPNEFGGFLVGYYSEDFKTLFITDQILPKKYKGFPYFFERSIDGLISVFRNHFNKKKQYYVGEWHTHPNGSTRYSQTDLSAMIDTAQCKTVKIVNPVLLILSINSKSTAKHRFYLYEKNKLIAYE